MEKVFEIDGKEVRMRASALIPRLYRFKFGRDMIKDMTSLAGTSTGSVNGVDVSSLEGHVEEYLVVLDHRVTAASVNTFTWQLPVGMNKTRYLQNGYYYSATYFG